MVGERVGATSGKQPGQDLVSRLERVILALERMDKPVIVVAHQVPLWGGKGEGGIWTKGTKRQETGNNGNIVIVVPMVIVVAHQVPLRTHSGGNRVSPRREVSLCWDKGC